MTKQHTLTWSLAAALLLPAAAWAQTVTLKPIPSGATRLIGGYMPQRLALSANPPAALTRPPTGLKSPMYGTLALGGKSFIVVVDRPDGGDNRIYVDTNGNGDLTDDPPVYGTRHAYKSRSGVDLARYSGSAMVAFGLGGTSSLASLGVYIFDKNDPDRAALKDTLLYYSDYALGGEIQLAGKPYRVLLADDMARGDFRGQEGQRSGVSLLIDRNGDGKFDRRSEFYDARKPFNVDGTTYEVKGLTAQGTRIELVRSAQVVPEIVSPPDFRIGKKALPFEATTTSGKPISFPASFKGKIVMLDFWATWCGPCLAEIPNVVRAYKQFHGRGFEILGISLDRPNMAGQLAAFTREKEMPWAQIYEGKYWDVSLVKSYGVSGIPFVLLVDGDTGAILADESTLRGPQLLTTIEKALAGRGAAGSR